jgi:uncharacterized protein YjdB
MRAAIMAAVPRLDVPELSNGLRAAGSLAALSLVLTLGACGGDAASEPDAPAPVLTSVAVSITFDSMRIGDAARATAEGRDQSGRPMRIPDPTWTSSDPTVATVSYVGVVAAVGLGTTRIVAAVGGKQGEVSVQVLPTPVAGVLIGPTGSVLAPGETQRLAATAVDAAGRPLPGRNIAWLSSDPTVATVSADGLVAAVAPGIVSVSAISESVYASVDVRVSGPAGPVTRVTVNPAAASLTIGQARQLGAILEDAEGDLAADRLITWTSTAPNVATVSPNGLVQAIRAGSAVIEATSEGTRGRAAIVVVDPLDAITVRAADPEPDETVGDTLRIYSSASARHAIVRVYAKAADRETELTPIPVGYHGLQTAWIGRLDLSVVRYGPYELVITATDVNGNQGIATIPFKRGTREGAGGIRLPARNK